MHMSPNLIIPSLKAGAHCREAHVRSAKLRNPSQNFKTPWTRNWSLWLKCRKEHVNRLVNILSGYFQALGGSTRYLWQCVYTTHLTDICSILIINFMDCFNEPYYWIKAKGIIASNNAWYELGAATIIKKVVNHPI